MVIWTRVASCGTKGNTAGVEVVEGRWQVLFNFVEFKGPGVVQARMPNGQRTYGFGTQESVQS